MYQLVKLNEQQVVPIITNSIPIEQIKGGEVLPMLYCNTFIAGMRGSGKTTSLFHIMKNCIDKDTTVIVFSNTHNCDSTWIKIKDWLESKNIINLFYSSIVEDGVNILDMMVNKFETDAEAEQNLLKTFKEQKKKSKGKSKGASLVETVDTLSPEELALVSGESKSKLYAPKYMIVFDDISSELRNCKSVSRLLKNQRHYKTKVIVSSQDVTDIKPDAKNQFNFWIIYKGFGLERFGNHIYDFLQTKIPLETLHNIYNEVTKSPGSFLMYNKTTGELRQNFSYKIEIS